MTYLILHLTSVIISNGKMKTKWEDRWFFEKNLRIQFVVVFEKFSKKFCVGCRCRTNLKFSNRHNSPSNGARESKIPSFDSESKVLSNCILRLFSKKIDLPTLFSFFSTILTLNNNLVTDKLSGNFRNFGKPF